MMFFATDGNCGAPQGNKEQNMTADRLGAINFVG